MMDIIQRISMTILGTTFRIKYAEDDIHKSGRKYIQVIYNAPCSKTGIYDDWKGRKWYLSEFMTEDEIVKTCYCAFKAAVEHEIMEGFKVDGTILFNPHINFEELLAISHKEIKRS